MNKSKFVIPLLVISVLVLGTVTALTITSLTAERINLFGGSVQDTDFTVTNLETQFKGKNIILIDIILTNTDVTNGHSGNLTVQLLDVSGDLLIEHSVLTGVVAPSGTYLYNNDFVLSGLVAGYDSTQIIIKQND